MTPKLVKDNLTYSNWRLSINVWSVRNHFQWWGKSTTAEPVAWSVYFLMIMNCPICTPWPKCKNYVFWPTFSKFFNKAAAFLWSWALLAFTIYQPTNDHTLFQIWLQRMCVACVPYNFLCIIANLTTFCKYLWTWNVEACAAYNFNKAFW